MPVETDQHPDSVTNQKAAPAHELVAGELRGLAPLEPEELKHVAAAATNGELLGQQRVLDAIRLAIWIQAPGYNVFATGVKGSTEREAILRLLREKARRCRLRATGFTSTTSKVRRRPSQSTSSPARTRLARPDG